MAIDDPLDEHEQSERVLDWLRQNGAGLIGGVVLGLGLIVGWQWWQNNRQGRQMQAGTQYQAAQKTIETGKLKQAAAQVAALPAGTYATLGSLDLAAAQVKAGDNDAAIATLQAAGKHKGELQTLVQQRLARLLIASGKAGQALQLLAGNQDDAQTLQIRGDAYSALDKHEQARTAYSQALVSLEVGSPQRNIVELKLSEVGGTPAKPEARS